MEDKHDWKVRVNSPRPIKPTRNINGNEFATALWDVKPRSLCWGHSVSLSKSSLFSSIPIFYWSCILCSGSKSKKAIDFILIRNSTRLTGKGQLIREWRMIIYSGIILWDSHLVLRRIVNKVVTKRAIVNDDMILKIDWFAFSIDIELGYYGSCFLI